MIVLANTPIPHEIPLPLPGDRALLIGALIFAFLAHILFVNLMLGGSLLTVAFEAVGMARGRKDYDRLAEEIAKTITVNKSLAVVLGVGPLLCINVVYTLYFYSANALTGHAWISVVPVVSVAFLLLYLHKYSWAWPWMTRNKRAHVALGAVPAVLFLLVPFIFLANVNLMLFPDRWESVRGFLSAVWLPNVLPRYLHFIVASIAVTGLVMAWYFGRRRFPVEDTFDELSRPTLIRTFLLIALITTMVQFLAGPLLLVTLPWVGLTLPMVVVILLGASFAVAAVLVLRAEVRSADARIGSRFWTIVLLLGFTVVCMATGRHMYRERALVGPHVDTEWKTEAYLKQARDAAELAAGALAVMPEDERLFTVNCSACHAIDTIRLAPSVREIAQLHAGKPEDIVVWAKAPLKKRPEFSEMPSMAHLGDENLMTIAKYILRVGAPQATQPAATRSTTTSASTSPTTEPGGR